MSGGLTPGQLTALRNLSRKQAGVEVDWINIADARALTARGLAERTRAGWTITPEGVTLLETEGSADVEGGDTGDQAATPLFTSRPDPQ